MAERIENNPGINKTKLSQSESLQRAVVGLLLALGSVASARAIQFNGEAIGDFFRNLSDIPAEVVEEASRALQNLECNLGSVPCHCESDRVGNKGVENSGGCIPIETGNLEK